MKFEAQDGPVFINPKYVVALSQLDTAGWTTVLLAAPSVDENGDADGLYFIVKGELDDVAKKLGLA